MDAKSAPIWFTNDHNEQSNESDFSTWEHVEERWERRKLVGPEVIYAAMNISGMLDAMSELLIILHLFNRNSNSNVSTDDHSRNFTVYVRVILELCFGQRFPNSDVSGSGCLWDYISKIITYYWSSYLRNRKERSCRGIISSQLFSYTKDAA